jgi:beta-glucosidase
MARLDDMVRRILRTMFRVGLFDYPAAAEPPAFSANTETPESLQVARTVSEAGTVLLKNQGGVLPITGTLKRIALIGRAAGPAGALLVYNGGGSGHIPELGYKTEAEVVSPLRGIQNRAVFSNDLVAYADGSSIQDAVAAASAADYAIVWANDAASEGTDRISLDLDTNSGVCTLFGCQWENTQQNELISAVAAANPNTIVVLNTAGPVLMPWAGQVEAILEAWYPGQEDGNAIAPLLFGDVNPSGKLPQTFPNTENELPKPSTAPDIPYTEGLLVGYRWYDAKRLKPAYPFGYGLSYTTFRYGNLRIRPSKTGRTARVTFDVLNTGRRTGIAVPQLYLGIPSPGDGATQPPRQLKGISRLTLKPGRRRRVVLKLGERDLASWDVKSAGWKVVPGCYPLRIGRSSRSSVTKGRLPVAGGRC